MEKDMIRKAATAASRLRVCENLRDRHIGEHAEVLFPVMYLPRGIDERRDIAVIRSEQCQSLMRCKTDDYEPCYRSHVQMMCLLAHCIAMSLENHGRNSLQIAKQDLASTVRSTLH